MSSKESIESIKSGPLFENLISVEKFAEALDIKPQTVRNWVAKRVVPFVRIGRKTMFRREAVEAWIKSKEINPCL